MSEPVLHPSITPKRVMDAVERYELTLDNPGFCFACGADADGCEPDATDCQCEICGEPQVFGAMYVLVMIAP